MLAFIKPKATAYLSFYITVASKLRFLALRAEMLKFHALRLSCHGIFFCFAEQRSVRVVKTRKRRDNWKLDGPFVGDQYVPLG